MARKRRGNRKPLEGQGKAPRFGCVSGMEIRMRKLLREIYPSFEPIYNYRPEWLSGLEIDVYYPGIKVAFEFNGLQHYEFHRQYHKTQLGFIRQLNRDFIKAARCDERDIDLLEIRVRHCKSVDTLRETIDEQIAVITTERSSPLDERASEILDWDYIMNTRYACL